MSNIGTRLHDALSKLAFCMRHAASMPHLWRLLLHTKALHRHMMQAGPPDDGEKACRYLLRFKGKAQPFFLRTFSGDLQIFYEVFWRQVYAVSAIKLAACRNIVDLGANVGMSALYFAIHAPQATVWAVEPDPENFGLLLKNTQGLDTRIHTMHAAAASTDSTILLQKSRYAYNSKTTAHGAGTAVPGISLYTLICRYQLDAIDLLKIDIEGAEADLFAANTEWLHIVQHVLIEIHSAEAYAICHKAFNQYHFKHYSLAGQMGEPGIYHAYKTASSN